MFFFFLEMGCEMEFFHDDLLGDNLFRNEVASISFDDIL